MKILYISQRFPYPPDRGDRIPTFNHIKFLSQAHDVHVASLLGSRSELRHVPEMQEWARSVTVEFNPRWKSFLGKVAAFFSGRPLSLGHFWNERLQSRVRELVEREGIEAVVVFSSSMAQYVEPLENVIRIMNFCDLDSQKWADLSRCSLWPKSWIYRREARLLLAYERKIASVFDRSCVVTENEAALFRALLPGLKESVVLANGVDHAYFKGVRWNPGPIRLAFVGVMNYEPNVEAVEFFVREVWPAVRARYSQAVFTIVGSNPSRRVQALSSHPGVRVTGFVKDVRAYLSEATLVVVPLKVARGIQNKILEAMAAGVPVLTTPPAAGGLHQEAHDALFIADRSEPGRFAECVTAALEDRNVLGEKAAKGRTYVETHCSWKRTGMVLENILFESKSARLAETAPIAPKVKALSAES